MHTILSVSIIILCVFLFFTQKHKALIFIFIFTLFNGDFQFNIGASVNVYHFITLLYIPRVLKYLTHNLFLEKITRPLVFELIIIFIFGVIFGFISPFDDPFASYRGFTQQASMRAVISFTRMLLEFFSILLVTYWIGTRIINMRTITKYFSIVVVISFFIAILVFFIPGIFRELFPNFAHHFQSIRFTGLVGEPRTIGRFFGFGLLFILFYENLTYKKVRILAIVISSLGVFLSLSASALIVTVLGLIFYFGLKRKFTSIVAVTLISIIGYVFILTKNDFFQNTTLVKIQYVFAIEQEEKTEKSANEPEIFTRFEVFDRAALNFLYNNPQFLIFGVGPNLISIPASQYLSPDLRNSEVYGNGINSVPTTFLVNIISRSGFVGLLLQLLFFIAVYKKLVGKNEKYCFLTTFIMSLITATNIFLFITGVSISIILLTNRKLKLIQIKNGEYKFR